MRHFEGISEAADAIREFFFTQPDGLPAHVRAHIQPLTSHGTNPVRLGADFVEAAFANAAAVAPTGLEIAAGTAEIFYRERYFDRLFGRAHKLTAVLRRESGERAANGHPWPKAKDDPEPMEQFLPPPADKE